MGVPYERATPKAHSLPDKAQQNQRDSAHTRFQEIAFAYAILSDDRRRKRYDTTGNTSESLEIEDDDFNWSDFYKAQWADAVTVEKLNDFKTTYKHSEEERQDVLTTYRSVNGDLDMVFTRVMLSNPLEDEDRFRGIINDAIAAGEVDAHKAFTHESEDKRRRRHRRACGEGREAEEYAKELGVWDELFGSAKNKKNPTAKAADAGLMELIQKRKRGASSQFLDNLEAKYGAAQRKGKKQKFEEPPEELFQKNSREFHKKARNEAEVEVEDDDDEDEVDLEVDSPESDGSGDEEEEEIKSVECRSKLPQGIPRPNKRTAKKGTDIGKEKEGKATKPKTNGVEASSKKKTTLKDTSLKTASNVDDEGEGFTPAKSKSKGAKGRPVRSPRIAKKRSYVEAESSESNFEEDEEEQEFKPANKSRAKAGFGPKRGKGRTTAVRKER